jgi:hypothetical protein
VRTKIQQRAAILFCAGRKQKWLRHTPKGGHSHISRLCAAKYTPDEAHHALLVLRQVLRCPSPCASRCAQRRPPRSASAPRPSPLPLCSAAHLPLCPGGGAPPVGPAPPARVPGWLCPSCRLRPWELNSSLWDVISANKTANKTMLQQLSYINVYDYTGLWYDYPNTPPPPPRRAAN